MICDIYIYICIYYRRNTGRKWKSWGAHWMRTMLRKVFSEIERRGKGGMGVILIRRKARG
jgi:hypothetical protein